MLKEAAHGFRNLYGYSIKAGFERPVTQMKTKNDEIVNSSFFSIFCSCCIILIPLANNTTEHQLRRLPLCSEFVLFAFCWRCFAC